MRNRTPARYEFTVVDVIVTLGVIALLPAMLLTAVQQARETARRVQCSSRLKQIGLAFHNSHNQSLRFPGSTFDGVNFHQKEKDDSKWWFQSDNLFEPGIIKSWRCWEEMGTFQDNSR